IVADEAARIGALQRRVEVLGVMGRPTFAPRMTVEMKDGRRFVGQYNGRELMWDFARDAREPRRFVRGLPLSAGPRCRLVATIATLETVPSVDTLVNLTLGAER